MAYDRYGNLVPESTMLELASPASPPSSFPWRLPARRPVPAPAGPTAQAPAQAPVQAPVQAQAPDWRRGGIHIYRGPDSHNIFVKPQPQARAAPAMTGDPVADFRAQAMAAADAPFTAAGGQEHNYGYLSDQEANWNAQRPTRLAEAMAAAGKYENDQANAMARTQAAAAQMMQAESEAAEREWGRSPQGLKARMDEIAVQQGNLAATNPVAAVEQGQYVPPLTYGQAKYPQVFSAGESPPTMDEALRRYIGAGLPPVEPGSADDRMFRDLYGTEIGGRERGEPAYWAERRLDAGTNIGDILQLGLPSLVRQIRGARDPRAQSEDLVRKVFPKVGVQGGSPKVGVGAPAAMARRAARRAAYNQQFQGR